MNDVTTLMTVSYASAKFQHGDGGHDNCCDHDSLYGSNGTDGLSPRDRWVSVLSFNYSLATVVIVAAVLFCVIVLTAVGNALVGLALLRYRQLRTISNYLIGNLALSDFLIATTILPLSTVNEVLGHWVFGRAACNAWLLADVLYCTASLWNLAVIALDRYTATLCPLWYREKRSTRQAALYGLLVWLIAVAICLPPLLGWNDLAQNYVYDRATATHRCELFETPSYVLYSAVGSFFTPFTLTLVLYVQIFVVLRRRMRRMRGMGGGAGARGGTAALQVISPPSCSRPGSKRLPGSLTASRTESLTASQTASASNSRCLAVDSTQQLLLSSAPQTELEMVTFAAGDQQIESSSQDVKDCRNDGSSCGSSLRSSDYNLAVEMEDLEERELNEKRQPDNVSDTHVAGTQIENNIEKNLKCVPSMGFRSAFGGSGEKPWSTEARLGLGGAGRCTVRLLRGLRLARVNIQGRSMNKDDKELQKEVVRAGDVSASLLQDVVSESEERSGSRSDLQRGAGGSNSDTDATAPLIDFVEGFDDVKENTAHRNYSSMIQFSDDRDTQAASKTNNHAAKEPQSWSSLTQLLHATKISEAGDKNGKISADANPPTRDISDYKGSKISSNLATGNHSKRQYGCGPPHWGHVRWSETKFSQTKPGGTTSYRTKLAKGGPSAALGGAKPSHQHKRFEQRELQATIRMAIIIVFFWGMWIGFFTLYVLRSLCDPGTCPVPRQLAAFFFWLGYLNSGVNPVLYTIFNDDFRRAFQNILGCAGSGAGRGAGRKGNRRRQL